jgi:hypothetical protein
MEDLAAYATPEDNHVRSKSVVLVTRTSAARTTPPLKYQDR